MIKAAVMVMGMVTVTWSTTSCTDFDREDRIEDMRIFAIKTEPAEILYNPFHLTPAATRPPLPLPPIDVAVEVFAYDPRGGRTSLSVQLCPAGAGDATCRLYNREDDLDQEPASARDELRALLTPQVSEDTIDETELAEFPAGRVQPSTFNWSFSAPVIDFFIPDSADGTPVPSIFPLLPRVVAIGENLDQEAPSVLKERAFKRIPVALDLTSAALPPEVVDDLASALGVALCAEPIPEAEFDEQGRADCLLRRTANNNPALAGLFPQEPGDTLPEGTVSFTDDLNATSREQVIVHGSTIGASPGATLQLTPVFGAGNSGVPNSVERYQVISFDIEASKIIILNRVEDLACNWYSTRGELSSTLTAEQFNPSLGITWTLPTDAEPGQRDVLVLVVLDQRGGTDVAELTVEYQ
jgi:hypothetical protein